MVQIDLKNGYYVEVDTMNYTLKQRYTGKSKTGKEKTATRTCGYFSNMKAVMEQYLFQVQLDVLEGERMTLNQYIEAIEQINAVVVQGLESVLSRYPVK